MSDRVLIKPVEMDSTTKSGLIISSEQKQECQVGIIVATGNDIKEEKELLEAKLMKRKVIFPKYCGTEVKFSGETYILIKESDALAIIKE